MRLSRASDPVLLIVLLTAAMAVASVGAEDAAITAALAHPDRTDRDRARDHTSRPGEVLSFLGVTQGAVVLDLLGGDGYYSELMARVVGDSGRVYLHNNQAYVGLIRRNPRRFAQLTNLEVYVREMADINLPSGSVDLVLMVKVYHDLYYTNNGWAVAPGPLFDNLWRILKPGGVLGVIDHAARHGSGSRAAQNLHRIDPNFAKRDIESRGFEFNGESTLLINPEDDLERSSFHAAIRGNTSRFLHRYFKTDRLSIEAVDGPVTGRR